MIVRACQRRRIVVRIARPKAVPFTALFLRMTQLDLRDNDIGDEGAVAIAKALASNRALTRVCQAGQVNRAFETLTL